MVPSYQSIDTDGRVIRIDSASKVGRRNSTVC